MRPDVRGPSFVALKPLAPSAFVDAAYQAVLGRPPHPDEAQAMRSSLEQGESRAWLVGRLRYGVEGRARGAALPGLSWRYAAQRLLRAPLFGPALAWLDAMARLPSMLRRLRALEARDDGRQDILRDLDARIAAAGTRIDALHPPPLDEVLEMRGTPLADLARERFGLPREAKVAELTPHERYAMFETVFYESHLVAAKQRVYVHYLNRDLAHALPFLDLGCGRGEFLRILREAGVTAIGVDVNPIGLAPLRADGLNVVEADLLSFLEADRAMYCGASLLQVAEHLTDDQLERVLALVAARLAPGAVFFVETPNPLSGLASGGFHTDPTHLRPLPPERLRYQVEAAGFERACTLFQARIPPDQFAGSDPRAYYLDYAIIASRSPS